MKHVRKISQDGRSSIVDATGKPLGTRDASTRVLHVLPKLFVPISFLRWLDLNDVELQIISDLQITPEDGPIIRQPLPNMRYFVGGSSDLRYGWLAPLPDDVSNIEIEFQWRIRGAWKSRLVQTDDYEVRHKLSIALAASGVGNTFTMDAVCWPLEHRAGPLHAWLGISDWSNNDAEPDATAYRDVTTSKYQRDDGEAKLDGFLIEENVSIPGMKMDQLWTVGEFEHPQLHELEHRQSFTVSKQLHEENAACCLAPDIFMQAVQLARTHFFGPGSAYFDNCEDHPANRLLAQWWQKHKSDLVRHEVGFAMPWVRVEDDDRYWCGYCETPDSPMKVFTKTRAAQARVGDHVLLVFYARKEHFISSPGGLTLVLADGQEDNEISGIELDEHDEAWYALRALQDFPARFPSAWNALLRSTT